MTEWEDGDRNLHRRTDLQDGRDVRNATGWFDRVADAFRTFGWDTAAENLRRYRSGAGEPKIYSRAEIERHNPILTAEDRNRTWFESRTLLGKTENDVAKNLVLNIKDGETVIVHDDWDASIFFPRAEDFTAHAENVWNFATSPGTYAAFGRGEVKSKGRFEVARRGNIITADGEVIHGFDQDDADRVFDFNPGQPGHAAATVAEAADQASPFSYGYEHKERNQTTIRILSDGSRVVERSEWWKTR